MYTKASTLTLCEGQSKLHGSRSEVVALFADLRAFSPWCEKQDLAVVADLMQTQIERVVQRLDRQFHILLY